MNIKEELHQILERRVAEADRSDPDWWDMLLMELPTGFAKGYLTSETERLNSGGIPSTSDEYFEVVKELISYDIWK